jgi:hypothetical protein
MSADNYPCCVCGQEAQRLILCDACAGTVQKNEGMVPEQISMTKQGSEDGCLVDAWGRIFCLGPQTELGRDPEGFGVAIHQGSISRRHAIIEQQPDGGFSLRDLGSTNGTQVGHRLVENKVLLTSGDHLLLGTVGFYFISPRPALRSGRIEVQTISQSKAAGQGFASYEPTDLNEMESLAMNVIEATGGGGGFVEVSGEQIQISLVQLELLKLLMKRMVRDRARPAAVRGYLHSSEILAQISWDTAHPSDNHVKQLVRRLRRSLARSGRDDLIESQQGLGYRLSVLPTQAPSPS